MPTRIWCLSLSWQMSCEEVHQRPSPSFAQEVLLVSGPGHCLISIAECLCLAVHLPDPKQELCLANLTSWLDLGRFSTLWTHLDTLALVITYLVPLEYLWSRAVIGMKLPQELWGLLVHPVSVTELCPKLKE